MKHTPGPWKIVGSEIWAGSRRITMGRGSYDEKDRETRKANARLIASAPDLLEALKDTTEQLGLYLSSLEDGKDDDAESAYQHGIAIISKAEGRE